MHLERPRSGVCEEEGEAAVVGMGATGYTGVGRGGRGTGVGRRRRTWSRGQRRKRWVSDGAHDPEAVASRFHKGFGVREGEGMTHGADDGGAEVEHLGDVVFVDGTEGGWVGWPVVYTVEERVWWKAVAKPWVRFCFNTALLMGRGTIEFP